MVVNGSTMVVKLSRSHATSQHHQTLPLVIVLIERPPTKITNCTLKPPKWVKLMYFSFTCQALKHVLLLVKSDWLESPPYCEAAPGLLLLLLFSPAGHCVHWWKTLRFLMQPIHTLLFVDVSDAILKSWRHLLEYTRRIEADLLNTFFFLMCVCAVSCNIWAS